MSKRIGDDRYKAGTSFSDIYGLFLFDRGLRELTFHYLIRIEALVRTACAYCFSDAHRGPEDYLKESSFATEGEYLSFGLRDHAGNLRRLTKTLRERAAGSRSEFIEHYRNAHEDVPLWVLANDLTFGNVQHFFNLMKPAEQKAVCRHIASATKRLGTSQLGYFDPSEAKTSLDYLVKFRNNCAHDDRMYCAKVGPHNECDYATMLRRAHRFLPEDEYREMVEGILGLLNGSASTSPAMRHLIENMGFSMEEREGALYVGFKQTQVNE